MEEKFELNAEGVSGLSRRGFVWLGGAAVAASGLVRPGLLEALAAEAAPRGTYMNPVIRGDRPDAGALRVGDDYYLTHTTDRHTPGLLLWHSRDLVHWKAVGAALDRIYMVRYGLRICASTRGSFYIYFPCDGKIDGGPCGAS